MTAQAQQVRAFGELTLQTKVERLLDAAVNLESSFSGRQRRLGHPGDWPFDYQTAIAFRLFKLPGIEWENSVASIEPKVRLERALRRLDFDVSAYNESFLSGSVGLTYALVGAIRSYIGFVDGLELNEYTGGKGTPMDLVLTLQRNMLLAIVARDRGFRSVFLGAYGFVMSEFRSVWADEQLEKFGCSYAMREFEYLEKKWTGYAAGIEF
jgi:hypothetical protein